MSALEDRFEGLLKKYKIKYKREVLVIKNRKFRWDFLVTLKNKKKIAVEVHGGLWSRGAHVQAIGVERDCFKTLLAMKTGVGYLAATSKGEADLETTAEFLSTLNKKK